MFFLRNKAEGFVINNKHTYASVKRIVLIIQSAMVYTTGKCRRESPRLDKQVKLSISRLQYPMSNVGMKTGYTSNVSETGLCFTTDELLKNGTILQLIVELLGWQHYLRTTAAIVDVESVAKPLTAVAEVVWSKKMTDDEERYAVGVQFKDIYEDDLQAFKTYLRKMLDKKS